MITDTKKVTSLKHPKDKVAYEIQKAIEVADSSSQRVHKRNLSFLIHHFQALDHLTRQVLDITSKRDYYQNKLLSLLNEHAPDVHAPAKLSSDYSGPDPTQISNRYHATLYLRKCLLESSVNRSKLRDMITHHSKAQLEWQDNRQNLMVQHNERVRDMERQVARKSEGYHPSKMQKMRKELTETLLSDLSEKYREALSKCDENIWRSCRALSVQLARTLREMKVPFFCTEKKYQYPELKADQEYLLAKIQQYLPLRDTSHEKTTSKQMGRSETTQ